VVKPRKIKGFEKYLNSRLTRLGCSRLEDSWKLIKDGKEVLRDNYFNSDVLIY
jgi:hypothetical protein